ncbi:MAG: hypothetical protein COY66_02005 [Candidatus Kerfeldbacteria bacterium CG_4_10_14_0_8_um_filter_42_10]|uniref:DUF3566 domain-containing protein n=1 Tax=Candidatus Kerfeldbacteria bacterium CG_4_10_14_0_8_um_filter_42_10 TaxID=2014248 RepID=A0A2M7RJH9_9BACT|nr:MAG: hypothetical protein COY66_02005 [Candidatus Kerfeldbacteria bacterium CG_4_10_14_0_8_um_filter_42_10]
MIYEVKKLDAASLAKTVAAILGALMMVFGVLWIIMAIVAGVIRSAYGATPYPGTGLGYSVGSGLIILIFGSIAGAVIGLVLGTVIASVYNMAVNHTGGLRLELGAPQGSPTTSKNSKKKLK